MIFSRKGILVISASSLVWRVLYYFGLVMLAVLQIKDMATSAVISYCRFIASRGKCATSWEVGSGLISMLLNLLTHHG